MPLSLLASVAVWASACWTTEYPEIPATDLAFTPRAEGAPEGWMVSSWPMGDLRCPDGYEPQFWLVHPASSAAAMPTAVIYHRGAFDYVVAPDPADPTAGETWQATPRLTRDFATREVYDLLGMGTGDGTGALVAGLAAAGYAVLLPSNCWGDLWADSDQTRRGDIIGEGFARHGYDAAMFGWRMASDEAWAPINRVALPVPLNLNEQVLIGLGSGGRAVSELLGQGEVPAAAILDASPDDLTAWYTGGDLYPGTDAGLARIFNDEADGRVGSIADVPVLPDRINYLWSRLDPSIPVSMHEAALTRLDDASATPPWDYGRAGHALLANDPELVAGAVTWLLAPPPQ